jgi:hypothetical protein
MFVDAARSHQTIRTNPNESETPDIRTNIDEIELI